MKLSLSILLVIAAIAPVVFYAGFTWFQHASSNLVIANAAIDYEFDLLLGIDGNVSFANTNFGDEDLKSLVPTMRNHLHLKTLDFSGTQLSDLGLSYLQDLPNVSTIDVRDTPVTEDGVAAALACLPNVEIKY